MVGRAFLCFIAVSLSQASTILDELLGAFKSEGGLLFRATQAFSNFTQFPQSACALRWDLPPALYVVKAETEVTGFVLQPKMQVECAYPVNGNSDFRKDAQGQKDLCGHTDNPAAGSEATNMSGACSFATPKDYAQAYFNIPQRHLPGFDGFWNLNWATCHFGTATEALEAQKAVWQLATKLPPATTAQQWLRNASKVGFALTAFNEIVVAPVHSAEVRAVFWAHSGPFRDPGPSDWKACMLAQFLKSNSTWPIIEVADVILERPTANCEIKFDASHLGYYATNASCLTGYVQAMKSLEQQGPAQAARIFRELEASSFLKATEKVCRSELVV